MNWYYHSRIGLDMFYFWKNIRSMTKGLIIPAVVGTLILLFVNTNGILRFSLFVAVYSVVYAVSMWLFGLNDEEKRMVTSTVRKIRRPRK